MKQSRVNSLRLRRPGYFACWIFLFACCTVSNPGCAKPEPTSKTSSVKHLKSHQPVSNEATQSLQLRLLDGSNYEPFNDDRIAALVLIFSSTDCPIANAYLPYLKDMETKFSEQGIVFVYVHPSADTTQKSATQHANEFSLVSKIALDPSQSIAKKLGAEVTPSVFVLTPNSTTPFYQGAIDNLYADYGKKRRQANQHYLFNALHAITTESELLIDKTMPIGCFIDFQTAK